MATVGVLSATLGILDGTTGQLVADEEKGLSANGLFKVDAKSSKGVTAANITGLAASITKIYGSNMVTDSSVGIPAPQCALSANDIPHEIVDKVTGMEIGEDGAATSYTKLLPSVPLIVETTQLKNGKSMYFVFFDSTVVRGEENLQTNNTAEQRVVDALTFSANARVSDGANFKMFYADADGFDEDKMLEEVFPGYSPSGNKDTPAAVKLTADATATVKVGETAQVTVTATPAGTAVTYKSGDDTVFTVDAKGKISGVKEGSADLTTTAGDQTATTKVTVTAASAA